MTLVHCGSLASVHSHKPASPSRVSASFLTSSHCSSYLAQLCKHRLASVLPTSLTILARIGAILSVSSLPDYCWVALQRTRASLLRLGGPYTRKYTRLSWVSVTAGRVSAESRAPFTVSGQKPPVKAPPSVIAVCACETFCCATPTSHASVGNFCRR